MSSVVDNEVLGREFHFTDKDFQRIKTLIYDHAGINLSDNKKSLVYSRVARRLRATGLARFHDYLELLESGDEDEWQLFVNVLTTNLTAFFREPHHFTLLAEHVSEIKQRTPIKLWCAASSTGEEAYTMAMTMIDLFGSYTPPVQIVATDLDTHVLATARAGIYPYERVAKMDAALLRRFFLKGTGSNNGFVRVRPELRNMIVFQQLNLLDSKWSIQGPFDAIFCRNVMIYFDRPTQRKILERLAPLMRNDALLFAGHSENFHHVADLFVNRGRTIYTLTNKHIAEWSKING
jgi:chemotaxis protein methyltransferase CheR